MAKLNKKQLLEELTTLGVKIPEGEPTNPVLEGLLKEAQENNERLGAENEGESSELKPEPPEPEPETVDDGDGEGEKAGPEDEIPDSEDADNERLTSDDEGEPEPGEPKDKEEKDYLLKYQYGSDDNGPMKYGDPKTNPAKESKAEIMKETLLNQLKVKIIVPKAEGEDPTARLSVNLNGYRLDLPKNTYLDVPEQIADIIIDSQKQQTQALMPFRIDRDQKIEDVLG